MFRFFRLYSINFVNHLRFPVNPVCAICRRVEIEILLIPLSSFLAVQGMTRIFFVATWQLLEKLLFDKSLINLIHHFLSNSQESRNKERGLFYESSPVSRWNSCDESSFLPSDRTRDMKLVNFYVVSLISFLIAVNCQQLIKFRHLLGKICNDALTFHYDYNIVNASILECHGLESSSPNYADYFDASTFVSFSLKDYENEDDSLVSSVRLIHSKSTISKFSS